MPPAAPSSPPAPTFDQKLRLVWITDSRLTADQTIEVARQALEGGVTAVQLRRHDYTAAELFALGTKLRRLTRDRKAVLIVNDRVDVALAVGADGVHLGRHSLPPESIRPLVAGQMALGYSAHSEAEIATAAIRGADYCSLSPIFTPISKEAKRPSLGLDGLKKAAGRSVLPIIALGGITPDSAAECIRAGAAGVMVSGALGEAGSPLAIAGALAKAVAR